MSDDDVDPDRSMYPLNELVGKLTRLPAATTQALNETAAERHRQITVHGWDPEKDVRRPVHEWGWLLATRAVALSCPFPPEMVAPDMRRQLVEIAAIAVAALEAWDSMHPEGPR